MASSDLVGSVHDYHVYGDYAKVTSKPLTYCVLRTTLKLY
jgi:hypothetical protein